MNGKQLKDSLLASTVIAGTLLVVSPTFAQTTPGEGATPAAPVVGGSSSSASPNDAQGTDASGNASAGEQGVIVVTGSRIANPNLTSPTPLTIIGGQEAKLQGNTRVEDLLNNLPQVFAGQGGSVSNGATGIATVDLRGLGSARTLVLVNGKRLMPGDPLQPSADLNQIPSSLIQRVEVLTGGASSVYGSDAVSGVVNFVLNKDFDGVRLDAQYTLYNHQNHNDVQRDVFAVPSLGRGFPFPTSNIALGATKTATLTIGTGTGDGRGHVTAYASYRKIDAVTQDKYDYSACSLAESGGGAACSGSGTTSPARFILNGGAGSQVTLDPAGAGNTFRPYVGTRDAFNFAPYNYYQRPDEKYAFGAFAHYEVSPAFDPYMEAMFTDDHTKAQIAPSGIFGQIINVNCDNPLLSASQRVAICGAVNGAGAGVAGTSGAVSIGKRNVEGGGRVNDLRHTSYRIVTGVKGQLGDAWSYDVYGQIGRSILSEEYINDFSLARSAQALNVVTLNGAAVCANAAARAAGCAPYNIFQVGQVSQAALTYLQTPGFQEGSTTEYVAEASLSGQLGQYGLQSPFSEDGVGVAIGAQYRKEELDLRVDSEFSTGDLAGQGGPTAGNSGKFDVKEFYGEVTVPLVSDKPFINNLYINAGYRYSDYSTAGKTDTYKLTGAFSPIKMLTFRGGYNRAVRAPNIVELFTPQNVGLFAGSDPCAGAAAGGLVNGNTAAQCARTGVTAAQFGNIAANTANQYNQFSGGNPNLRPEVADTYTAGVLIAPREGILRGFSLSVDYYDIKIKKTINSIGASLTLQQCLATGSPTFCSLVQRDPTNGSLFLGTVGRVINTLQNIGSVEQEGIDFASSYRLDLETLGLGPDKGSIGFDFVGTRIRQAVITPGTPVGATTNYHCETLYGITCGTPTPRFRSKLRVTYNAPGNIQFSVNWRHVSSVKSDQTSPNPFLTGNSFPMDAKISSYDWYDLALSVKLTDKYSFNVGANNILDRDPPLIGSNSLSGTFGNGNTYPQVYDALGRYIYAGVSLNF